MENFTINNTKLSISFINSLGKWNKKEKQLPLKILERTQTGLFCCCMQDHSEHKVKHGQIYSSRQLQREFSCVVPRILFKKININLSNPH